MASDPKDRATSPLVVAVLAALGGYFVALSTHSMAGASYGAAALGAEMAAEGETALDLKELEESEGEEEEEDNFPLVCTSALAIVLVLIALTIVFEEAKHKIGHAATRDMAPIIESLFGELTVLGFLALVTFVITKTGIFEALGVRVFGHEEEAELLELFEAVHFALFGVMVIFVLSVLKLVKDGARIERGWGALEREARDGAHVTRLAERQAAHQAAPKSLGTRLWARLGAAFPSLARGPEHHTVAVLLRHYSLRQEFLLERSLAPPFKPADERHRVPDDFDFGRYLSVNLGKVLAHSVHLGVTVWMCAAAFAVLFYGVMLATEFDPVILAWVWAAAGYAMFLAVNTFDRHLMEVIQGQATLHLPTAEDGDPESKPLVNGAESSAEGPLPPWCKIDMDVYNKQRSWIIRTVTKDLQPNRQDALYWLEREGPEYNVLLFQSSLLWTAIYGAVLLLTFLPLTHAHSSPGLFALYVVVALAPILVSPRQLRNVAAHMTQANCVGTHRKPQSVNEVQTEAKTTKAVRAFLVINKLLYAAENDLLVGKAGGDADSDQILKQESFREMEDPVDALSPVERAEIEKLFAGFDTDGSGSVTAEELEEILKRLGASPTPETLAKIVKILDEDGNGEIDQEEFLHFYARNIYYGKDPRSTTERARDLFDMFDDSKDGQITIGEFKAGLDAFNYGFTVDEVGALLRELDEDESGTITMHEFEHLLHKFEEQLTPHAPRDLPVGS